MVNWACQLTDDDLTNYRYRLTDPKKDVPLMTFANSNLATRPILNYLEKQLFGETYEEVL